MHPRTAELLAFLDQQRQILRSAYESVPAPMRDRAPAPDAWSVANIIEHLAMVERRFADRLSSRIAEAQADGLDRETSTAPIVPTFNLAPLTDRSNRLTAPPPVHPSGVSADAAWQALEDATAALRAAILQGDGLALGTITMAHPVFGQLPLYHYIAVAGAHECRHAAQIREIAAAAT